MPKAPTAQAVAKALAKGAGSSSSTPDERAAETAEQQRLRAIREAEARWAADDERAKADGFGGLVPGTRMCWVGLAGCAHARAAADAELDDRDLEAIRRYPTPPPPFGPVDA